MVLFLPILGWSSLRSLGQFDGSRRRTTCKLHKKMGDPARVCRPLLQWLSQFLSYKKEKNSIVYGVIAVYLFCGGMGRYL